MKVSMSSAVGRFCTGSLLTVVILTVFAEQAMAQEGPSVRHASGAWWLCVKEKWPDARIDHDSKKVFIPETGQNLAWDKDKSAWIDVKTGQAVRGNCKTLAGACWRSIRNKWPDVRIDHDSKKVFIPETGQNLAWDKDKQAWIDVKTGKCICPECEETRTAHAPPPTPTPSTTDKVTDVLKTIGGSVSIGIGGGGGEHHRHEEGKSRGEDRTRTADKVKTDNKLHPTSKQTTSTHKTVTAACKCHPCTCSPCTCH